MVSKLQHYVTSIVTLGLTMLLTFLSDFALGLPQEITWLTFATGTIVVAATTLMEQRLSASMSSEINRKLEIYALMEGIDDPELRFLAHKAIGECEQRLREYQSGIIVSSADARSHSTLKIGSCRKSFEAVYVPAFRPVSDFESTAIGQNYYQANVEAVLRNVNVERIFVLDKSSVLDGDGQFCDHDTFRILERMAADGIGVRVSWFDEIERMSKGDLYKNFGIFDGEEVLVVLSEVGRGQLKSTIVKHPDEVAEYQRAFRRIRDLSVDWQVFLKRFPYVGVR